jgi:hypothetical protein
MNIRNLESEMNKSAYGADSFAAQKRFMSVGKSARGMLGQSSELPDAYQSDYRSNAPKSSQMPKMSNEVMARLKAGKLIAKKTSSFVSEPHKTASYSFNSTNRQIK